MSQIVYTTSNLLEQRLNFNFSLPLHMIRNRIHVQLHPNKFGKVGIKKY